MGGGHAHGGSKERNLGIALGLTASYLVAEVVGGLLTGSLALLSDAAHMLTDVAALAISLVAIRLAKRPADARRTFGYYRFEILAAAFNAAVLFVVAFYILFEAYQRFREPAEIESIGMLAVAAVGLIVNLISVRLLRAGSSESLNVKSAYLEVWSDLLGSVAVIAAALVIRLTGWVQVDPILAVVIGFSVLPRTWKLMGESVNILLEGVPQGIDLGEVRGGLDSTAGVQGVHDLHVWSITSGKASASAHVVVDGSRPPDEVVADIHRVLKERFGIEHSTIQVDPPSQSVPEHEF